MKIVLVNPPHTAIGSRIPDDHLPPLGLLCVGGPLIDAGFPVALVDADLAGMKPERTVARVRELGPDVVMLGHSGSTSAHATVVELCALLKRAMPGILIVYGGVHPSYAWDDVLAGSPDIDIIVREGERTALRLVQALAAGEDLSGTDGIAFREAGRPVCTPPAEMITDLDEYRVAWELINHKDYSYWGGRRAVVVQFSRGCPHRCSFCGQRGYWTKWRHRDPVRFAKELARLWREEGVEVINFADELPTGSREAWKAFLEALIAEKTGLVLVASTRAGDIVRDRDILHLYKKAGVIRFLLGIESYDKETLQAIQKGAGISESRQAIRLLRKHGIISMATYVLGLKEERDDDYWNSFIHLVSYDSDQIQVMYATPHRWTRFYDAVAQRRVIQTDTRLWDYKHQVLAVPGIPPWRVFAWFKAMEVMVQLRPKVLMRMLFHRDPEYRHAMRWYTKVGRRVWFHEIAEFMFGSRRVRNGPRVRDFLGPSLIDREYVLAQRRQRPPVEGRRESWARGGDAEIAANGLRTLVLAGPPAAGS